MLADTIAIQKVRRGNLNEIEGCRGNACLLRGSYIENVTLVSCDGMQEARGDPDVFGFVQRTSTTPDL